MATVMASTTWRARVGRRECRLGGVDAGTADGARGIGGNDPKGHHIRRAGCCWLLVVIRWRKSGYFVFGGDKFLLMWPRVLGVAVRDWGFRPAAVRRIWIESSRPWQRQEGQGI